MFSPQRTDRLSVSWLQLEQSATLAKVQPPPISQALSNPSTSQLLLTNVENPLHQGAAIERILSGPVVCWPMPKAPLSQGRLIFIKRPSVHFTV